MAKDIKYVTTPVLTKMLGESIPGLDPDGKHVLVYSMLHNDVEIRGLWMLKMVGQMLPFETLLTVPIEAFNAAMRKAKVASREARDEAGC